MLLVVVRDASRRLLDVVVVLREVLVSAVGSDRAACIDRLRKRVTHEDIEMRAEPLGVLEGQRMVIGVHYSVGLLNGAQLRIRPPRLRIARPRRGDVVVPE